MSSSSVWIRWDRDRALSSTRLWCAVSDCSSSRHGNDLLDDPTISFHSFPLEDPILLATWLRNMGKPNWKPSLTDVLCSKHFSREIESERCGDACCIGTRLEHSECPVYFEKDIMVDLSKGTITEVFGFFAGPRAVENASDIPGSEKSKHIYKFLYETYDCPKKFYALLQKSIKDVQRKTKALIGVNRSDDAENLTVLIRADSEAELSAGMKALSDLTGMKLRNPHESSPDEEEAEEAQDQKEKFTRRPHALRLDDVDCLNIDLIAESNERRRLAHRVDQLSHKVNALADAMELKKEGKTSTGPGKGKVSATKIAGGRGKVAMKPRQAGQEKVDSSRKVRGKAEGHKHYPTDAGTKKERNRKRSADEFDE